MSMHKGGLGLKVDPAFELQADFTDKPGDTQSELSWNARASDRTDKSGVSYMAQGAGRPGQSVGPHSIFGGNGPVFAQVPSYTPVTRAPEPAAPAQPAPQPAYTPYTAAPNPIPQPRHPNPQPSAPSYHNQQPAPAYQPSPRQPAAAPSYQPAQPQPQTYRPAPQNYPAPGYHGSPEVPSHAYQPQAFSGGGSGFPDRIFPDSSQADAARPNGGDASFPEPNFAEASFAEASFPEASFEETSFTEQSDAGFPEPSYPQQNFSDPSFADASFPDGSADANFAEHGFESNAPDHGFVTPQGHDYRGYEQQRPNFDASFDHGQDYGQTPHHQAPGVDPRRQLQAFDAPYDQPPQISLGGTEAPRPPAAAPQNYYEAPAADADFLDEGQIVAPPALAKPSKFGFMRGKSAFMVASALLGAIALGGALAFAYKQSGGSIGEPPVVVADNSPVKELPAEAGGKEFPHKNKLIYDRLTNEDQSETANLVPRQEEVAVPALPTAGLPNPVASTDFVTPPTAPVAAASLAESPEGGPRKVKTMVVRPDGSVMAPEPDAAAPVDATAAVPAAAAAADAAAATAQAAPETPAAAAPEPAPQQVAAVDPTPAPAAPSKFAVQLGAQKSQTEALAAFADIQQKNPTLLASYRPMVSKADLGAKGTLYRLRIGPISGKTAADKLCGQLKSQGTDCFVVAQ